MRSDQEILDVLSTRPASPATPAPPSVPERFAPGAIAATVAGVRDLDAAVRRMIGAHLAAVERVRADVRLSGEARAESEAALQDELLAGLKPKIASLRANVEALESQRDYFAPAGIQRAAMMGASAEKLTALAALAAGASPEQLVKLIEGAAAERNLAGVAYLAARVPGELSEELRRRAGAAVSSVPLPPDELAAASLIGEGLRIGHLALAEAEARAAGREPDPVERLTAYHRGQGGSRGIAGEAVLDAPGAADLAMRRALLSREGGPGGAA